ncbi:MAG: hypothetical protein EA423_11455, partial [Phycisphaerales bacterium]
MADQPDISRRKFLRGHMLGRMLNGIDEVISDTSEEDHARSDADTPDQRRASFPILRPPGAVEEERFLRDCTRCDACLKACPPGAIIHAPGRFRKAAGTPMIDPMRQPCTMCPDTPCVAACDPGVLSPDLPIKMGAASVSTVSCLAHNGSFCTVCSEHCPVENAIEVTMGKPTINADACTGCGVCQFVCPAPDNAILLLPAEHRPDPKAPHQSTQQTPQQTTMQPASAQK